MSGRDPYRRAFALMHPEPLPVVTVTYGLVLGDDQVVTMTGEKYNEVVVALIRSAPFRKWFPAHKYWAVDRDYARDVLVPILRGIGATVVEENMIKRYSGLVTS